MATNRIFPFAAVLRQRGRRRRHRVEERQGDGHAQALEDRATRQMASRDDHPSVSVEPSAV